MSTIQLGLCEESEKLVRVLGTSKCRLGTRFGNGTLFEFRLVAVLSFDPDGVPPGSSGFPSPKKSMPPNAHSVWNAQTL